MIDRNYFDNAGFSVDEESFTFGEYNSMDNRMFVTQREAPTPSEREIVETVPYMQGVYDFSQLNGQRFYENREITYQVILFEKKYPNRKIAEQEIKRQLMQLGIQNLYDSHDKGYHWSGKCKSVSVDDDEAKGTLSCSIVFDCYPFAISNNLEGSDAWNDVFFPHYFFQKVKYDLGDKQTIYLYNIGSNVVQCGIRVDGGTAVVSGPFSTTNEHEFPEGHYPNATLMLSVGKNEITISGTGTIEFRFYREEMI